MCLQMIFTGGLGIPSSNKENIAYRNAFVSWQVLHLCNLLSRKAQIHSYCKQTSKQTNERTNKQINKIIIQGFTLLMAYFSFLFLLIPRQLSSESSPSYLPCLELPSWVVTADCSIRVAGVRLPLLCSC